MSLAAEILGEAYSAEIIRPQQFGPNMLGQVGALHGGGGGSTFDDMSWHDAVRRVDDKVDANFKWIVGVFGAGFLTLAGAFAAGYLNLAAKIDDGNTRILSKLDAMSSQIGELKTEVTVLQDRQKPRREVR